MFDNPFDAINEFNKRRCNDAKVGITFNSRINLVKFMHTNQKGVTIPSQLRYIEYYADFSVKKRVYEKCKLILKSIKIDAKKQNNDEISKSIKHN